MTDINPIITLTTDFGTSDNYVGIVKGIILRLNKSANLIDINHRIPPFNIAAARYQLETSYKAFPSGTIHLAVIDPGVGGNRKAIALKTADYYFLGPDNGLFAFLNKREIKECVVLNNPKYCSKDISNTFHARDVFAPVAGYLSLGIDIIEFGKRIKGIKRSANKDYSRTSRGLIGRLIYIDRFGNLVSSLKEKIIRQSNGTIVYLNGVRIGPIRKTFSNVKPGRPVVYINSFGYLEIGINKGSAAENFGVNYDTETEFLIAP